MPFSLPKRQAALGPDLNVKHTMVKKDPFSRIAIPVVNVQVTDAEFGEILLNDKAPKHFWKAKRGRESELMYPHLGVQQLDTRIRNCDITLWLQDKIMVLHDATITGSRFTLMPQRVVLWKFTIQALPNLDNLVLSLLSTLSQPILIEVGSETWGTVQELPIEEDEDEDEEEEEAGEQVDGFGPEDPEGVTTEQVSSVEKQIAATADKAKAKAKKAKRKSAKKKG